MCVCVGGGFYASAWVCGGLVPARFVRTAVNLQAPASWCLGAQQQTRRPEPMHASSPMSPANRPQRGMRKLMMREKQDLPAHGRQQNGAWVARARAATGHTRTPAPGRARLRVCPCVAAVCGAARGGGGWRAHDAACRSDALGLVGLLGQVGVVGAHEAGDVLTAGATSVVQMIRCGGGCAGRARGAVRWPTSDGGERSAHVAADV